LKGTNGPSLHRPNGLKKLQAVGKVMKVRKVRVLPHFSDDSTQLLSLLVSVNDRFPFVVSHTEFRGAGVYVGNPHDQSTYKVHRTEILRCLRRSKQKRNVLAFKMIQDLALETSRMPTIEDFEIPPLDWNMDETAQMPEGISGTESIFGLSPW
jgi:hypothetical protein